MNRLDQLTLITHTAAALRHTKCAAAIVLADDPEHRTPTHAELSTVTAMLAALLKRFRDAA
jgi:hypothetical protein